MAAILILDDHEALLRVLVEALTLDGHQIARARTGREGQSLIEGGLRPDIILCDMMMPDMNGIAFLQYVRAHPDLTGVHFIVMSGNGGDRALVLAAGADEYLAKPFSIPDLLRLIEGFA
ncbi:MAG: response regulator [Candidatus Flexifilum sp.]